jgi:hypothetical protein
MVICDNCRQTIDQIEEGKAHPPKFRIGDSRKDICPDCKEILFRGRWVSLDWVKVEMHDTHEELNKLKTTESKRKGDMIRVRGEIAEAIEGWAEGKDTRDLLTTAVSRVVKYTE